MTRLHIEVANHIKICGVSEYFIKMCLGHDLLSLYFISSFLIMILKSKTQILEYLNMKMNVKMDFFFPHEINKGKCRKHNSETHLSRGERMGLPQVIRLVRRQEMLSGKLHCIRLGKNFFNLPC